MFEKAAGQDLETLAGGSLRDRSWHIEQLGVQTIVNDKMLHVYLEPLVHVTNSSTIHSYCARPRAHTTVVEPLH